VTSANTPFPDEDDNFLSWAEQNAPDSQEDAYYGGEVEIPAPTKKKAVVTNTATMSDSERRLREVIAAISDPKVTCSCGACELCDAQSTTFRMAEECGFPSVPFGVGTTIVGGEPGWTVFCHSHNLADHRRAQRELGKIPIEA
jgi:hypothetical protein